MGGWLGFAPRYFRAICLHALSSTKLSKSDTRGVREIVSSDNEPIALPESVIEDLKGRCVDGVVELPRQSFGRNESVKVKLGPFRGWDAIFERYVSADERVALLLRTVGTTGIRVVLPVWSITKG
jgi:transcription antitermination factor NusG